MSAGEDPKDPAREYEDELDGTITTVEELNADISNVIARARRNELQFDFVIGDVSNDSVADGTRYFQLVNEDAGIQCLAFNRTREQLPEFEEGDRIAVKGRLNYYENRGNCSLYVDDVVLLGDSLYHKEIEQTRQALADDGLFNDEHKKSLPPYPSGIGIVTATGSDAEKDTINAIHSRHPDVNIYVCDSRVQGISAMTELCTGIAFLDAHDDVDVIVVTRGGGSEQDLHAFNTEGVSRLIFKTETPVVTAIGHENDRPIVDDVADARAMTPTEIGSVVVPSKTQFDEQLTQLTVDIDGTYNRMFNTRVDELHQDVSGTYTAYVSGTTDDLAQSVTLAYTQLTDTTVTDLRHSVTAEYDRNTTQRITELRNDVESAYQGFQQQKEHDKQAAELERKQQQYKKAAVVLFVLLLIVLLILGGLFVL